LVDVQRGDEVIVGQVRVSEVGNQHPQRIELLQRDGEPARRRVPAALEAQRLHLRQQRS
jgi:hypothetical protein